MGTTLTQLLFENVSFKRQSVKPTLVNFLQMTCGFTRMAWPVAGGWWVALGCAVRAPSVASRLGRAFDVSSVSFGPWCISLRWFWERLQFQPLNSLPERRHVPCSP